MTKEHPRLGQPLFSEKYGEMYSFAANDPIVFHLVRAYDAIWNLMYVPHDMKFDDIRQNASINLDAIGVTIEKVLGEKVFDLESKPIKPEGDK